MTLETIEGKILKTDLNNFINTNNITKENFIDNIFFDFQYRIQDLTALLIKYLNNVLQEFENDIPTIKDQNVKS